MLKPSDLLKSTGMVLMMALSACAGVVQPSDLWQSPVPVFAKDTPKSQKIASIALREHKAWGEPFITTDGKIAKYDHYEASSSRLSDGSLAWERVVAYWRDSGVLARLDVDFPYHQCDKTDKSTNASVNICRAFASDVAWSSAFVSYVMKQADVDFYVSPRHFDYIRHAWLGLGDYRMEDPLLSEVAMGDLLCYVRDKGQFISSYQNLQQYLTDYQKGVPAHCDIVVNVDEKNGEAWLVGGNVMHTVMLRKMPINAQGKIIFPKADTHSCTPHHEEACQLNRQSWVVVLKLQTS